MDENKSEQCNNGSANRVPAKSESVSSSSVAKEVTPSTIEVDVLKEEMIFQS